MAEFEDLATLPADFTGTVRLFPLPNLVLFPHVMQPLHAFEPRYRELLEDALAGDRLIAMALLRPGWERDYDGRPPIFPVACLGRIATHHRLDDGTYNVLLLGMRRVRLLGELEPTRSFRRARVEVCEELSLSHDAAARADLCRRLRQAFLRVIPTLPHAQEQLDQWLGSDVSLGLLTDVIGYMLDIDLSSKQALLAELSVQRRAEILLSHLSSVAERSVKCARGLFPPRFSAN